MSHSVRITLRIPGAWNHPGELLERLPAGFRLTPETLILPGGAELEFIPLEPDGQFPKIFESACRRPARREELAVLGRYTVNIGLSGPGGSSESALAMMQAGAAVVAAGGAGVFIDNSALAHGGTDWMHMTEDGGPDALSFAFTSIIRSRQEVSTLGLHALGFPDLLMRTADLEGRGDAIIDIIRYVCAGGRPIDVGHVLAGEQGATFQVVGRSDAPGDPASPMHNPYGRLKITSVSGIAESN